MSKLRIVLDDFVPNHQPRQMDSLELNVAFSFSYRTILQSTNELTLEFIGDAFNYLYDSMLTNGYNGVHQVSIQISIDGAFYTIFKGNIFISDCSFNLEKNYCEVDIVDIGYNSYIRNNIDIATNFTNGVTKNGNNINVQHIPGEETVFMINPSSNTIPAVGLQVGTTRKIYDCQDVLRYLVRFLSDNNLDYESEYLTSLFDDTGLKIGVVRGKNLRTNNSLVEGDISMQTLWGAISQMFNMLLTIDNSGDEPTVKIENDAYFKDAETVITNENIKKVERSYSQELLFSKINVGSNTFKIDGSIGSLPYTPPLDFANDEYYVAGVGNIDSSVEARSNQMIIDSNIIEDILVNGSDDWDEEWFLIMYRWNESTSRYEALTPASDIYKDGNYYYNGELINKACSSRYKLQGATVKITGDNAYDFSGIKGNTFQSYHSGSPALAEAFGGNDNVIPSTGAGAGNITTAFNTVIQDPSGSWNTSTDRYTASSDGMRNFAVSIDHRMLSEATFSNPSVNTQWVYAIKVRWKKNGQYIRPDGYTGYSGYYNFWMGADADTFYSMNNYDYTQQNKSNVTSEVNIYMQNTDYVEVEVAVMVGEMIRPFQSNYGTSFDGYKFTDIGSSEFNHFAGTDLTTSIFGGFIGILGSSSLTVKTKGSTNGYGITKGVRTDSFVNKFIYEDTLSANEIFNFVNSSQKAILLMNKETNLNVKSWAYNVSINLNNGKTTFETINNIDNL